MFCVLNIKYEEIPFQLSLVEVSPVKDFPFIPIPVTTVTILIFHPFYSTIHEEGESAISL